MQSIPKPESFGVIRRQVAVNRVQTTRVAEDTL